MIPLNAPWYPLIARCPVLASFPFLITPRAPSPARSMKIRNLLAALEMEDTPLPTWTTTNRESYIGRITVVQAAKLAFISVQQKVSWPSGSSRGWIARQQRHQQHRYTVHTVAGATAAITTPGLADCNVAQPPATPATVTKLEMAKWLVPVPTFDAITHPVLSFSRSPLHCPIFPVGFPLVCTVPRNTRRFRCICMHVYLRTMSIGMQTIFVPPWYRFCTFVARLVSTYSAWYTRT